MRVMKRNNLTDRNRYGWLSVCLSVGPIAVMLGQMPAALASPRQINLILNTETEPSFPSLMQKAEALARTSIDQAFTDASVTEVDVEISGERYGQEAPLILAKVFRRNWQTNSSVCAWAKCFDRSEALLGFLQFSGGNTASSSDPDEADF